MTDQETCAICGQGGYWVAWAGKTKGYRCVNHIDAVVDETKEDEG